MRSVLTTLSLLALGIWLGALLLFVQVAAVAFRALPPLFLNQAEGIHGAGLVVRGSLFHLHYLGLICGVLFLIFSFLTAIAAYGALFLSDANLALFSRLRETGTDISSLERFYIIQNSIDRAVASPFVGPLGALLALNYKW